MKIFSLPVLLIGAVAIVAGGGLIYAFSSSHRMQAVAPKVVAAAPAVPEVPPSAPRDETAPLTVDPSTPAPASPASAPGNPLPAVTAEAPVTPGARRGGQRGNGRMQQIYTQLGLTEDQQKQLAEIRAMTPDRDQRRQALMLVLTPEQRTQYQELRSQMQAQRASGQGGNGGGTKAKTQQQ